MFKLALIQRKYDQVLSMIKSGSLCGQSIIAYLQAEGIPGGGAALRQGTANETTRATRSIPGHRAIPQSDRDTSALATSTAARSPSPRGAAVIPQPILSYIPPRRTPRVCDSCSLLYEPPPRRGPVPLSGERLRLLLESVVAHSRRSRSIATDASRRHSPPFDPSQDENTRFNLALECGNIEVALASRRELDDKDTWHRLGVEALRQGNHQIVEFAYQKTKNFERLSFLYLITGNEEKLKKMLKIAEMRSDVMGQFHNALYVGDIRERCKILESSGHYPLAYLTAKTHGMTEDADRLEAMLTESGVAVPAVDGSGELLLPPTPILREDNWPLLTVTKGFFEGVLAGDVGAGDYAAFADEDAGAGAGWGEDLDLDLGGDGEKEERRTRSPLRGWRPRRRAPTGTTARTRGGTWTWTRAPRGGGRGRDDGRAVRGVRRARPAFPRRGSGRGSRASRGARRRRGL